MASYQSKFALDSYSTAVVVIPPEPLQARINILRGAHDKSCPRWTAHFTLLFPFVSESNLSDATVALRNALEKAEIQPFDVTLDHVNSFSQRSYDTVYLAPSTPDDLRRVWNPIAQAFGYKGRSFVPHLTLGQAEKNSESSDFLRRKGNNLIKSDLSWSVGSVVILRKDEHDGGAMKIYAEIPFDANATWPASSIAPIGRPVYHFDGIEWNPHSSSQMPSAPLNSLVVATYNVLHDEAFPVGPRIESLLQSIAESEADIICLQEVSDELLHDLSRHPEIYGRFSWSTRGPDETIETERNLWVLTRSHIPFTWQNAIISGKMKPVHVLSVNNGSLIVAAVHFTAGLTSERIRRKEQEFKSLVDHLQSTYPNATDHIIVGDTNFPTSMEAPTQDGSIWLDAWSEIHASDDAVRATYNPQANPLALKTSKEDKSPQRYDRLYLKAGGRFAISSASLFGVNAPGKEAASDHYGLVVTLACHNETSDEVSVPSKEPGSSLIQQVKEDLSDEALHAFLAEHSLSPTLDNYKLKEEAVAHLRSILTQAPSVVPTTEASSTEPLAIAPFAVKLIVQPVGSFALGVDFPESDVDCLVVGNISPTIFWALARQRIKKAHPVSRIKRFVKDAAVQMLELDVLGVKIDLQYCPAATLSEKWQDAWTLPPNDPIFSLPASTLRTLNAYRDMRAIQSALPSLSSFQLAHRSIKYFAQSHGIYSSRLGYLGGIHITLLLARVAFENPTSSAGQLVQAFFRTYADWDWASSSITIPGLSQGPYSRSDRDPLAILCIHRPIQNVAALASGATVHTISKEIRLGHEGFLSGRSWPSVCGSHDEEKKPLERFLVGYKSYAKVDIAYWGRNCTAGRALVGFLESRLSRLLIQLRATLGNIELRLWPERLVEQRPTVVATNDLSGFYLIGIKGFDSHLPLTVLNTFQETIRGSEQYYDSTQAYIAVYQVASKSLGDVALTVRDPFQWEDGGFDLEEDSDDEEIEPDSDPTWDQNEFSFVSSKRQLKKKKKKRGSDPVNSSSTEVGATPSASTSKLRTSADVYNRLMWDPYSGDKGDFVIGYEDRFEGVMEIGILNWKREVEDEAFVSPSTMMIDQPNNEQDPVPPGCIFQEAF
ncbi:hypothetical protein SISSUDRAFT_1064361 [Sistotremastrum suecicum HHB10207 ss-3]|uniref:polynucleotide adenylyltransferase n=1 Tax=Sistotremastrum suecicum HHB10207 ss-3 TaxID=1314776 RepID=A0A166AQ66_9AGAM|nr:hypothetical protein SISSUDRAFT_1064361 [Sistotremastrum suecicum HHB10207 ss-3]